MNKEPNRLQLEITRRDVFKIAAAVSIGTAIGTTLAETYGSDEAFAGTLGTELLQTNPNEYVKGLGDLEALCDDLPIFRGVMQFFDVSAQEATSWEVASLMEAVDAKLFTLSILDPYNLDLTQPQTEQPVINQYLSTLFGDLELQSIDPKDVGPFVLCPEFVVGFGGQPSEYADYLNLFLEEINLVAPTAHTSNMIDLNETEDLVPLLGSVNQELLDSVGIQAFADSDIITFDKRGRADISGYITTAQIKDIVGALGNKPMWLNTGIIRKDKTLGENGIYYSLKQRVAIAEALANTILDLKNDGINVFAVNLFAENKLNGRVPSLNSEKRDFSFHPGDEKILTTFAKRMKTLGVEMSGYAIPHDLLSAASA